MKQHRNIYIPNPCTERWEGMTELGNGIRHCSNCQHAVIDFAGKTEQEAIQILKQGKGNICGSFLVGLDGEIEFATPKRPKVRYLRHFAAAASILLFHQSIPATQLPSPVHTTQEAAPSTPNDRLPHPTRKTNTLVSGVIINTDESLIPKDVEVRILCNKVQVAKIRTRNGLFAIDLAGKVAPDEHIQIVVWKEYIAENEHHQGVNERTKLGDAQNMTIKMEYVSYNDGSRRGGRTLYINNI